MKSFSLDEFTNFQQYRDFLKYMLSNTDSFSLIYFRYRENERVKKKVKEIHQQLKKYQILSKRTTQWPNTETMDNDHIYKLVLYRSDEKCLEPLLMVDNIFSWNYPDAPMDLCFYRDGKCCLATTSHEGMAYLYTNNMEEVETLLKLGAHLEFDGIEEDIFL